MLDDRIYAEKKSAAKLAKVIGKLYVSIAEVELDTGNVWIFKNESNQNYVGQHDSWPVLVAENLRSVYPEDRPQMLLGLSLESMSGMMKQKENERRLEVRAQREGGLPSWVEIEVSIISYEERKVLVTARNIAEQRLLQNIVKLYVYSNCDYFIYLDVRNNCYEMLWGKSDEKTIPPVRSADYVGTFMKYIDENVVPEDRELMKQEVLPKRILAALDEKKEHTYSYGLLEPGRGYARKRIQYLYYDRGTQIILLSRTDVTELYLETKRQSEALRKALNRARIDPLTRVYNHQTIEILIREKLRSHNFIEGVLLFIDLDNFKQVNDIQGHHQGDEVLCHVASALQKSLRSENDLIGRVGGDEFIAFLGNPFSKREIERCVCRLQKTVSDYTDCVFPLTCSIGIACFPKDGEDYETLFKHADAAMYHAKTLGKDGFAWWDAEGSPNVPDSERE